MKGRSYQDSTYRYGFNGKENDSDFGNKQVIQDYGFRLYNPALGKFLSVDPLTPIYPWNSTYAFAEGDVIRSIDVDGLDLEKDVSKSIAVGSILTASKPVIDVSLDQLVKEGILRLGKDGMYHVPPTGSSIGSTTRIVAGAAIGTVILVFTSGELVRGSSITERENARKAAEKAYYIDIGLSNLGDGKGWRVLAPEENEKFQGMVGNLLNSRQKAWTNGPQEITIHQQKLIDIIRKMQKDEDLTQKELALWENATEAEKLNAQAEADHIAEMWDDQLFKDKMDMLAEYKQLLNEKEKDIVHEIANQIKARRKGERRDPSILE